MDENENKCKKVADINISSPKRSISLGKNAPPNPPIKRKTTKHAVVNNQNPNQAVKGLETVSDPTNEKKTSDIWLHFSKVQGSDKHRAACNYCGKTYAAHTKNNGTTSLWNHFKIKCPKNPYKHGKGQKTMERIECKRSVCLDVETRWNSTYTMLEVAEKFEKAFERLAEEDSNYFDHFDSNDIGNDDNLTEGPIAKIKLKGKGKKICGSPTKQDWRNARNFVKFLKIFYNITLKFSGFCYATSNLFFREIMLLQRKLDHMLTTDVLWLKNMTFHMKEKYEKYWGSQNELSKIKVNFLLHIAIILDPLYKLKYVVYCYKQIFGSSSSLVLRMTDHLEKILKMLYNEYMEGEQAHNNEVKENACSKVFLDEDDDVDSQFLKELEEEQHVEGKTEIQKYLTDACEIHTDFFDILDWWKVNRVKYPILKKIAKDILACPISTVSSESALRLVGV